MAALVADQFSVVTLTLWLFSISPQLQRVKLCYFPSDLPLFCYRSYSSTSIEEAMKRGEDPPTPPPRPQKTHSRASSLDLNKVFQPSVPGEVPLAPKPFCFLLEPADVCLPQRPLWVRRKNRPGSFASREGLHVAMVFLGEKTVVDTYVAHVSGALPTLVMDQELGNSLPRG